MSGYMDINDVPASGNHYLLHDVLRDRWHFNGFVVSDAWAVYNLTAHGFARDQEDAAFRGLTSASAEKADFRFLRFRPPLLEHEGPDSPALPHIRLDRALQFLIGDKLQ